MKALCYFAKDHIGEKNSIAFNTAGNFTKIHTHDYWEFIFIRAKGTHLLNGTPRQTCENTLLFIQPSDVHAFVGFTVFPSQANFKITDERLRELCGILDENIYPALRALADEQKTFDISQDFSDDLQTTVNDLSLELNGKHVEIVSTTVIFDFLRIFYNRHFFPAFHTLKQLIPPHIAEITKKIRNPEYFHCSLGELAEKENFSYMQLCRLFKYYHGKTMKEYSTAVKMKYARNMLKNTSEKIVTIAHTLGYATQSRFDQVFREAEGVTPREYRNSRSHNG